MKRNLWLPVMFFVALSIFGQNVAAKTENVVASNPSSEFYVVNHGKVLVNNAPLVEATAGLREKGAIVVISLTSREFALVTEWREFMSEIVELQSLLIKLDPERVLHISITSNGQFATMKLPKVLRERGLENDTTGSVIGSITMTLKQGFREDNRTGSLEIALKDLDESTQRGILPWQFMGFMITVFICVVVIALILRKTRRNIFHDNGEVLYLAEELVFHMRKAFSMENEPGEVNSMWGYCRGENFKKLNAEYDGVFRKIKEHLNRLKGEIDEFSAERDKCRTVRSLRKLDVDLYALMYAILGEYLQDVRTFPVMMEGLSYELFGGFNSSRLSEKMAKFSRRVEYEFASRDRKTNNITLVELLDELKAVFAARQEIHALEKQVEEREALLEEFFSLEHETPEFDISQAVGAFALTLFGIRRDLRKSFLKSVQERLDCCGEEIATVRSLLHEIAESKTQFKDHEQGVETDARQVAFAKTFDTEEIFRKINQGSTELAREQLSRLTEEREAIRAEMSREMVKTRNLEVIVEQEERMRQLVPRVSSILTACQKLKTSTEGDGDKIILKENADRLRELIELYRKYRAEGGKGEVFFGFQMTIIKPLKDANLRGDENMAEKLVELGEKVTGIVGIVEVMFEKFSS